MEGLGRELVPARAFEGCVRHGNLGGWREHAGAVFGDVGAEQARGRGPADAHLQRVHADVRAGGTTGLRHRRARRVLPVALRGMRGGVRFGHRSPQEPQVAIFDFVRDGPEFAAGGPAAQCGAIHRGAIVRKLPRRQGEAGAGARAAADTGAERRAEGANRHGRLRRRARGVGAVHQARRAAERGAPAP